jgi:hypothetical protein
MNNYNLSEYKKHIFLSAPSYVYYSKEEFSHRREICFVSGILQFDTTLTKSNGKYVIYEGELISYK